MDLFNGLELLDFPLKGVCVHGIIIKINIDFSLDVVREMLTQILYRVCCYDRYQVMLLDCGDLQRGKFYPNLIICGSKYQALLIGARW